MEIKIRLLLIALLTIVGLIIIFIMTNPKVKEINLINDYKIINEKDTTKLIYNKEEIITDYISEYSYGKRYILLKCVDNDINVKFYIIDTKDNDVHGPYNDYETFTLVQEEIVDEEIPEYKKMIQGD